MMVYDIWLYVKGIVCSTTKGTCMALAEMLGNVSHDRLTRVLTGNWSGQALLEIAFRLFFKEVLYHYSHRQSVDEVIKVLKSKLEKKVTIYKLKRILSSKRKQLPLPHLERLKKVA